jgi:hypothetical protein
MDDLVRDVAVALTAEGKKPKTVDIYVKAALRLQRSQGIEDWAGVTRSQIRAHIAAILETRSNAYASNQFRALQQFFKFLGRRRGHPGPCRFPQVRSLCPVDARHCPDHPDRLGYCHCPGLPGGWV